MPLRGSENPSISYYTNIILYKGKFYTEKEKLQVVNLNNRIDIPYVPSDISLLGKLEDIDEYDKGILLSDTFHYNMGHLLWDFMYPSYYGLLFHKEEDSNNDFQWMTLENINKDHHIDIIEKFSGNKVTTPILLSNKYEKPLKIPYLIVGIQNIGIGCVKKDFNVSRQLKEHENDPVETFVNRMYLRYNIKRNTFINKTIHNSDINIIYVNNKRPYNNIDLLFNKIFNKYSKKYSLQLIDWSKYTFENQLKILNETNILICGVGTARTNSPFLPNGSIEIQTNTHSLSLPNNINYFDYHIGGLSKYIKVININNYTIEETNYRLFSDQLEKIIDDSLNMLGNMSFPLNTDENIPEYILNLRGKVDDDKFNEWRNSLSNDIGELIKNLQ